MATKKLQEIDSLVVNTKVMANIFGVTERRVRQMVEEEIIDRVGHGRYNLLDSVKKYIAFLRANNAAEEQTTKLKESLEYEKYLHERAKREMAELELARLKGQMHYSVEVEKVMNRMLADFRSKLLALPSKVAPMLIAREDISFIQDLLQKEIYEALQELSEYDPSMFGHAIQDDDEDEEAEGEGDE